MSRSKKIYNPSLARGDIMGLAELDTVLMLGSMTPAPLTLYVSVWRRTTHDISLITHSALMQTRPSLWLCSLMHCFCNPYSH